MSKLTAVYRVRRVHNKEECIAAQQMSGCNLDITMTHGKNTWVLGRTQLCSTSFVVRTDRAVTAKLTA